MSAEESDTLKNASAIIERFGGIRPMAAKVGAPVTTVQGWKKRDAIPGSRKDDVIKAANENNIDLSDLLSETIVPESTAPTVASFEKGIQAADSTFTDAPAIDTVNDNIKITVEPIARSQQKPLPASFTTRIDTTHEELMAEIVRGQKKAVRASMWTTAAIITVLAVGAAYVAWPSAQKIEKHETQIATLEGKIGAVDKDVQAMNETAAELKDLVPEEMKSRFAELKLQAQDVKNDVENLTAQAQDISKTVLAADAGSISDRLSVLEAKLGDVEGGQALQDLTARIRNLEVTLSGQEQMGAAMAELTKIVDSLDGQVNTLDDKLAMVQQTPGSALGQTLEGISDSDLKAAALLIAFSQLRDSMNRNAPIGDDVVLLQKLVGDSEPELQAALARLAPQAEKGGVLTPENLAEEFKGLSGDIVFSSLKGEDVSMTEKAKVRLTQMLNVKKDGELIGGTETQKTVSKAQEQLNASDVSGAIATLKTLDPQAKEQAAPFIEQAEATILADQIQGMLRQMIVANVGTNVSTAAGAAGAGLSGAGAAIGNVTQKIQEAMPSQEVVKDEESGFAILPSPKGFKGFSSGPTE